MTDVEGVRNLIGTGLVDFVGGILTALLSLVVLLLHQPHAHRPGAAVHRALSRFALSKAFRRHPADLPRARQDQRRSHRPAHRIAGRRARGEGLSRRGAKRPACSPPACSACSITCCKALTAISLMSLSATVLMGMVGATVMYLGARQIMAGTLTLGGFMTFTAFLAFLVAPMFQVVGIGTQITEALAGLDRTQEVLHERPEDEDPRRTTAIGPDPGLRRLRPRDLRLRPRQAGAARRQLRLAARHGDRAGGPVGLRQIHHHQPDRGVSRAHRGRRPAWMASTSPRCGWTPTARSLAWCCRTRSCSTASFARTWPSRGRAPPKRRSWRPAASRAWTSSPKSSRRNTTPSWASAA